MSEVTREEMKSGLDYLLDLHDMCICDEDPEPVIDSRNLCPHCAAISENAAKPDGNYPLTTSKQSGIHGILRIVVFRCRQRRGLRRQNRHNPRNARHQRRAIQILHQRHHRHAVTHLHVILGHAG